MKSQFSFAKCAVPSHRAYRVLNRWEVLVPIPQSDESYLVFPNEVITKRIKYHSRIAKAVQHLEINIGEHIDLQGIADVACMEKTAFSKLFRRAIGIRFRDFLQTLRVGKAMRAMMESDTSLTQIALSVGFESFSSFERTFKKLTNTTPSAYRRRCLLEHGIVVNPGKLKASGDSVLE